jgi:hypothetical protein
MCPKFLIQLYSHLIYEGPERKGCAVAKVEVKVEEDR